MRNLSIVLCHVFFAVIVFFIINIILDNWVDREGWLAYGGLVVCSLFYVVVGYLNVNSQGSWIEKLFNISIISVIGIVVWSVCLYIYLNDNIEARIEQAVVPFVLPSEIHWLPFVLYNVFTFFIWLIPGIVDNSSFPPSKYVLSTVLLMVNFCPMLFMWVGLMIRQFINKRQKPQNP